ncbi:MAG: hypothetical protein ACSNEK_01530 [Parachlamydiaceae bacterium]
MKPLLLFILLLTVSCSSNKFQEQIIRNYSQGHFERVEASLSCDIQQQRLDRDFTQSKNAILLFLNRATARFANGKTKEAIEDFDLALQAIDYYQQDLFADIAKQLLADDRQGPYKADDFEQTLARLYFALALLNQNDENNACAIFRQAEEIAQKKESLYRSHPLSQQFYLDEHLLLKVLFSYYLQKSGDLSNALILKNSVEGHFECTLPDFHPSKSLLIILCHNGLAPFKLSTFYSQPLVSNLALDLIMQKDKYQPNLSSITGIPLPELCSPIAHYPIPFLAKINHQCYPLRPFCDIGLLAENELHKKMPLIVSKAVARFLMRDAFVNYMNNQDSNLGSLTDLGVLLLNSYSKADTRSWNTLPMTIDAAFILLEPGSHHLELNASLYDHHYYQSAHDVYLKPGTICLINLFHPYPGVGKVIISKHDQIKD